MYETVCFGFSMMNKISGRFHVLGEFDEAKRSCRRRLAGHNERRRKSSQEHNSLARKHYHGNYLFISSHFLITITISSINIYI